MLFLLLRTCIAAVLAGAAQASTHPVELGQVTWGHDVEAGFAAAKQSGRPLLLLFQEIPGCATCKNFGSGPLSQPLLVDAIESEFVPVVVTNNRPGADAAALQRFDEPACNNPVLRFFAADGTELLSRRDGIWEAAAVASRLEAALRAAGRAVPPYLALAAAEARSGAAVRATFGMHCFWEGEAALGGLDGVLATRAGHLQGEVVEVTFLPELLSYERLLQIALEHDPGLRAFARDETQWEAARRKLGAQASRSDAPVRAASDADQKWYLRQSPFASLPLTPAQAARMNADVAAGRDPSRWLSPRQRGNAP